MKYLVCLILSSLLCAAIAQESMCTDLTAGDTTSPPLTLFFGAKDSPDGEPYHLDLGCCWWARSNSEFYFQVDSEMSSFMYNIGNFWINHVPLFGGKNFTFDDNYNVVDFTPTANFSCGSTNSSALWGPAYPDYREGDLGERGRFQNLETYVHYSAPNESSYVRHIVFVKNTGATVERVRLWADWYTNDFGFDRSPLNAGRYQVPFPYQEGDMGFDGTDPASTYNKVLSSIHARGQGSLDTTAHVYSDMDDFISSFTHYTELQPGATWAAMIVVGFGRNLTQMLATAAHIDSEPAELFHDLNADQLALISNWGGCKVILGPQVTVTVTAPSQCSSAMTSDFTVSVETTSDDFTADFMHRVVSTDLGVPLGSAQAGTTLTVPNDIGSVTHQLWYNGCLVKETEFTACARAAAPNAGPVASTPGVSSASTLGSAALSVIALALL